MGMIDFAIGGVECAIIVGLSGNHFNVTDTADLAIHTAISWDISLDSKPISPVPQPLNRPDPPDNPRTAIGASISDLSREPARKWPAWGRRGACRLACTGVTR